MPQEHVRPGSDHPSTAPESSPLLEPDVGLRSPTTHDLLPGLRDRVRAVLLGTAVGDAVGHRLEPAVREQPGPSGAGDPNGPGTSGDGHFPAETSDAGEPLAVCADTQMTLYTLDGLLEALEWANAGQPADETACLWLAYLRWYRTQEAPWPQAAPSPLPRWIDAHDVLHEQRTPGRATLEALGTGAMGEVERPLLPDAMGAGAVLRSAPLGLLPVGWKSVATMSVNGAAITHGHPEAQVAAVAYALMVQAVVAASLTGRPRPVLAAAQEVLEVLPVLTRPGERTIALLRTAVEDDGVDAGRMEIPAELGTGCSAPNALATGVWAAVTAEREANRREPVATTDVDRRQDQFVRALSLGILHDGDSGCLGSTASSVAGALSAAALGSSAVPEKWARRIDVRPVIDEAVTRWCAELGLED